jgi:hypothetical protein
MQVNAVITAERSIIMARKHTHLGVYTVHGFMTPAMAKAQKLQPITVRQYRGIQGARARALKLLNNRTTVR